MRLPITARVAVVLLTATGSPSAAQGPITVPIRPLGAVVATSDSVRPVSIRALPGGSVLVDDPTHRQLILLDSMLKRIAVAADTTSATDNAYGEFGFGTMIPFRGDSTLVQDVMGGSFNVISPSGKITRIMAALSAPSQGMPTVGALLGFDQAGHLIYRSAAPVYLSLVPFDFIGDTLIQGPDSIAILRRSVTTRRLDTIAMAQAPRVRQAVTRQVGGRGSGRPAFNPFPAGDDWAVMNDGTIAIVRVRDYHIDWVQADGHVTSGPQIPTQRIPLTDSMKAAIMDSVRALNLGSSGRAGVPPAYVRPSDLPDIRPPFRSGSARADADGNVWIREEGPAGPRGGIYDVIGRTGLIDRVQIPDAMTLVGFGPGVAYLMSNTVAATRFVKARIR